MDQIVYAVAVPVASLVVSAAVEHFLPTRWVRRISNGTLAAEAAVLVPAWLILLTLPRVRNPYGDYGSYTTCATIEGTGFSVVVALAVASVPIAAVALTSSWTTTCRRAGGAPRFLAVAGAAIACFAIFVGLLYVGLCGAN